MGAPRPRAYGTVPPLSAEHQRISDFLTRRHHADTAAGNPWPVPLFGQFLYSRQIMRSRFGSTFVHMLLEMAAAESGDQDPQPADLHQEADRIFAGLDAVRQDPEGTISNADREDIRTRARELATPVVLIGRRVLSALVDHPARGIADDALLAVELQALTPTVVQNDQSAA